MELSSLTKCYSLVAFLDWNQYMPGTAKSWLQSRHNYNGIVFIFKLQIQRVAGCRRKNIGEKLSIDGNSAILTAVTTQGEILTSFRTYGRL